MCLCGACVHLMTYPELVQIWDFVLNLYEFLLMHPSEFWHVPHTLVNSKYILDNQGK